MINNVYKTFMDIICISFGVVFFLSVDMRICQRDSSEQPIKYS